MIRTLSFSIAAVATLCLVAAFAVPIGPAIGEFLGAVFDLTMRDAALAFAAIVGVAVLPIVIDRMSATLASPVPPRWLPSSFSAVRRAA